MPPHRVAVAYSGGRDSTALLHAAVMSAQALGITVIALHVNHGLSPNAAAWQAHAQRRCKRWARRGLPIEFDSTQLDTRPDKGESIEAWARAERYRALTQMARTHDATLVLLAHHRRDQAETLLLQALRGSGVAGLAGMPRVVERDGITWARPWLDIPREDIVAYLARHRLGAIDDESNDDVRYARNRLRHDVWPAFIQSFPQAEASLAAAAKWAQEAVACLDEVARADLAIMTSVDELDIREWAKLSRERRSNALRAWLRARSGAAAPATLVKRLSDELMHEGSAQWPFGEARLDRYRDMLSYVRTPLDVDVDVDDDKEGALREATLSVTHAGDHALPGWGGQLRVLPVDAGGVPLAWVAHLELKPRSGGEKFQAGFGRPPRSLKKQFQSAAVPAWERDGPLVYSGGQLVFVPGLGVDARVVGLPGQDLVTFQWVPSQRSAQNDRS